MLLCFALKSMYVKDSNNINVLVFLVLDVGTISADPVVCCVGVCIEHSVFGALKIVMTSLDK